MTIRVLLVDDHWEVRERMRVLLMQEPDIELVGEAEDGAEALCMLGRLPAEVVVIDLNLPEISGIETARRILADRTRHKDHHRLPAVRPALREGEFQNRRERAIFLRTAPLRSW